MVMTFIKVRTITKNSNNIDVNDAVDGVEY